MNRARTIVWNRGLLPVPTLGRHIAGIDVALDEGGVAFGGWAEPAAAGDFGGVAVFRCSENDLSGCQLTIGGEVLSVERNGSLAALFTAMDTRRREAQPVGVEIDR